MDEAGRIGALEQIFGAAEPISGKLKLYWPWLGGERIAPYHCPFGCSPADTLSR